MEEATIFPSKNLTFYPVDRFPIENPDSLSKLHRWINRTASIVISLCIIIITVITVMTITRYGQLSKDYTRTEVALFLIGSFLMLLIQWKAFLMITDWVFKRLITSAIDNK